MDFLMNGLLLAATCFSGAYCWVLARRVRDLKSLDKGLGGAIVTLTRQVELARTTLEDARRSSGDTKVELSKMVERADTAASQLRLLIAAAPHAVPAAAPAAAPLGDLGPTRPATGAPEARAVRREPPLTAGAAAAFAETPEPAPAAPAHPGPQLRLAPRPRPMVPAMSLVEDDAAEPEPQAAPLVIPSLDRLTAGPLVRALAEQAAEPARPEPARPEPARPEPARAATAHLAEVPKPRALAPIENPLRRIRAAAAKSAAAATPKPVSETGDSEDALLEALSALAGGR